MVLYQVRVITYIKIYQYRLGEATAQRNTKYHLYGKLYQNCYSSFPLNPCQIIWGGVSPPLRLHGIRSFQIEQRALSGAAAHLGHRTPPKLKHI